MTNEELYSYNTKTGDYKLTPAGIKYQAKSFWRDSEFYNVCCDNEDEDDLCHFDLVEKNEDGDLIVYNECKNREGPVHSYYITLLKEDDGGHSFFMSAWNSNEHPEIERYYEGDLLRTPSLTPLSAIEVQFWSEVAKLYPTIPDWMLEFDLSFKEDEIEDEDEDEDEEYAPLASWSGAWDAFVESKEIERQRHFDITAKLGELYIEATEAEMETKNVEPEQETYTSPFDGDDK